jgi:hypothetical protein
MEIDIRYLRGEGFVTREFVNEEWNKRTARRFGRWIRSLSGLERPFQKLIDEDTNKEFTEIQGKTLYLLNPDEVWESGQVMLKRKPIKRCPWRGFRLSPVRVFLRKREGCVWKDNEKKTFTGRVVRMLRKNDARKSISLFEKDHQGIRVQPGWLGISSPRSHMRETPSRKGWWQIYWNQKFVEQAGRIKRGLDHTKVKNTSEIIEWPAPEPMTTRVTIRYQNHEVNKEFRRRFECERIIDWAEKTWEVSPELTAITLNGVDWTPSNFLPQNCIIDFVPRFREQSEIPKEEKEDSTNEVTVFVNILDQERVWKLKKDSEWSSFKSRVDEIADDVKWSVMFNGQIWDDDSRSPTKNTKIMVNFELLGGEPPRRLNLLSTHITLKIDDRDPFPLGLIRGKEWENFKQCMDLIFKGCCWSAFLRGQLWMNDDRKPLGHDGIQIRLAKLREPVQKAVQVFVKVGTGSSQIVHLQAGREWEHFKEWMAVHHPIDRWADTVNGHVWEDDSFAPSRDQTIRVNVTGEGGGKKTKSNVWIKIGNTPKNLVELIWNIKDCWDDFRSKVVGDFGHDA